MKQLGIISNTIITVNNMTKALIVASNIAKTPETALKIAFNLAFAFAIICAVTSCKNDPI